MPNRTRTLALLFWMWISLPGVARDVHFPSAGNTHAGDVARSHVKEISGGKQVYSVVQGGTMDGRNCRSPMSCGISGEGAFIQTWESNRWVRMENVGQSDVINPWLSNGSNAFRSADEIVASAIRPGMTDAEKAFALWFQEIRYRHHSGGDNNELGDPVKVFNIYGYNTCGNDSIALATLWRKAGLKVAPARALGHCISQVFYDGGWHFYDGDMHCVYLLRDNQTVAGEQDLVRDHDLIKRTHSQGILMPDNWWNGPGMAALYCHEGEVTGERGGKGETTMNMALRPGEALVWRWGQTTPLKYHGAIKTTPTYKQTICNGLWEYRPDLSGDLWRKGTASVENIAATLEGLTAADGKTGLIIWTMKSPYIFVGGRLGVEGTGAKFFVCQDGKTWRPAGENLDKFFQSGSPACYQYQIKCELAAGATLKRFAIINDVQMAPLALPEMGVGENQFTYTDQSPGERKIKITHSWVERSITRAPAAPEAAIHPADGGESDGTDIRFEWKPAVDPDGDVIADYQFELSPRQDMAFPLSMSFYKLIHKTADVNREKGKTPAQDKITAKPRYTLTQAGLLAPDKTYYWRVKAKDAQGVWGPWSNVWSFTARGPAHPVDVKVDFDPATSSAVLRWKANPAGRAAVKYRVYGSDEKGFTASDQRYQCTVGESKKEMADWYPWFPANFIAETTSTQLAVLGPEVRLPQANRTYFRVVAVDEKGKRSGSSDFAEAPRPVIYSAPIKTGQVGAAYRYQARANRSLGDLVSRMENNQLVRGYFNIEYPRFALEKGPAWLKIDSATGELSGTPDAAGDVEVVVNVTIDRQVRKLDEAVLKWGNEKVLSVDQVRVGAATQRFTIQVR